MSSKKSKTAYQYKCHIGYKSGRHKSLVAFGPVTLVRTLIELGKDPRTVEISRKRRGSVDHYMPYQLANVEQILRTVCGSVEKANAQIAFNALAKDLDRPNFHAWWRGRAYIAGQGSSYITYEAGNE